MGMAGDGAGPDPGGPAGGEPGTLAPGEDEWRDWAGLPQDLLVKVAGQLVAQTEAAHLKGVGFPEKMIQEQIAKLKLDGNSLFMFARVCKGWRKAQLKVGGPLRTQVYSDVIAPGSVALVKWALAEGCPRESDRSGTTMAEAAAPYGHLELVKWLCGEGGFAMDKVVMGTGLSAVMAGARFSGNQELVDWLQANGSDLFSSSEELSASH